MSPVPAFSRRHALLGGAAVVAATALSRPATARADGTSLAAAFDQAAEAHGVPRDLLVALAWSQTRLQNHQGQASGSKTYGITSVSGRPGNDDLTAGAKLTDRSPNEVRTSDAANIAATAALLAARADKVGLSSADRRTVASWYPVLVEHSGAAQLRTGAIYADSVFGALVRGTGAGAPVRLPGAPVAADRRSTDAASKARELSLSTSESAAAAIQAWANPANYTAANRPSSSAIDRVVIHMTQGSYAGAISWFQNPSAQVSAHYVIRSSDGEVTQTVRHKDIAWHAGSWAYNQRSIGIEHEGFVDNPSWFTGAMYQASAKLVRDICNTYGIPKTRERIVAHSEVPGATHTDPGRNWNWAQYMELVTGDVPPVDAWTMTVDNSTAGRFTASANWELSTYASSKHGPNYAFARPVASSDVAWYSFGVPAAGNYKVDVWYPSVAGYNAATPFHIATSAGNKVVYVNQSSGGGGWRTLGTFPLAAKDAPVVGVSRWTSGTGYVIADAVRLTRA
ncbi:MAG: N-acetylmuramoyl-L-alanine amidase [Propionibacteriales bacterium]|nr:N-acetylmuramoyl-L-alanine amidase [Propionibacteriales bacterium]